MNQSQAQNKQCQNCKKDFIVESDDFSFYEKIKVPPPTFCPECRLQRRLAYKNEKTLYKRICDKCKKNIISVFSKDAEFPVYCPKCWYADDWGADEFNMDYNPNKNFFVQFKELINRVPRLGLYIDLNRTINSEYLHLTGPTKNCYLIFLADQNEDCMYSNSIFYSKNLVDSTRVLNSTKGYELINCENCYQTIFSCDCRNCIDVNFSKNCNNCSNCFGCVNLVGKKFCFFNQQLSEEDYKNKIKEFLSGSFSKIDKTKKETNEFFQKFPVKYLHGNMNINISGDYIFQSKNVKNSFEVVGGTDNKYCQTINMKPTADCYDYSDWGNHATLMYETVNCGEFITRAKFSYSIWLGSDYEYCDTCIDGKNLFGCILLRKKQYCILNKQYTKEEYEKIREEIIKDMNKNPYIDKKDNIYKYGEFFPIELSPYPYRDTAAFDYFPLDEKKIKENNYFWKDNDLKEYIPTIKTKNIPDNINDVSDNIISEIIECAHIGKCKDKCITVFKITLQELQFYKDMQLPIPHLCFNCRHYERFKKFNPWKLYHRKCMKEGCENEFETTYSPDRLEIVYCEKCYQNIIY